MVILLMPFDGKRHVFVLFIYIIIFRRGWGGVSKKWNPEGGWGGRVKGLLRELNFLVLSSHTKKRTRP